MGNDGLRLNLSGGEDRYQYWGDCMWEFTKNHVIITEYHNADVIALSLLHRASLEKGGKMYTGLIHRLVRDRIANPYIKATWVNNRLRSLHRHNFVSRNGSVWEITTEGIIALNTITSKRLSLPKPNDKK